MSIEKKDIKPVNISALMFLNIYGGLAEHRKLGFIDSFIRDSVVPVTSDHVLLYLLYKPAGAQLAELTAKNWEHRTNKVYQDYYAYKHGYKVVVVRLPKEFEEDFHLFLEGRYSEMSQALQKTIPETMEVVDEWGEVKVQPTRQHLIFSKNKAMLEYSKKKFFGQKRYKDEVHPVIDIEKETLYITGYYKNITEEKEQHG